MTGAPASWPVGRPWLCEISNWDGESVKVAWFKTQYEADKWGRREVMNRVMHTAKVTRRISENQMSLLGEHPPVPDRVIPGQQMIAPAVTPLVGPRDGETFATEDTRRLNRQALRVYGVMQDEQFHSLHAISERTGDPEASISARLRDLRKARFGGHTVQRRRVPNTGIWTYRLVWNEDYPRPSDTEVEGAYE